MSQSNASGTTAGGLGNLVDLTDSNITTPADGALLQYNSTSGKWEDKILGVAYIKDVKPSGTAGGTFTSGAWRDRILNTLEGDSSFASIASNEITLQPGKYDISGLLSRYGVNVSQARLRDTLNSVTTITSSGSDTGISSHDVFIGILEITIATTYKVQHYCNSTRAGDGFGTNSGFGEDNVYAQIKITKLR